MRPRRPLGTVFDGPFSLSSRAVKRRGAAAGRRFEQRVEPNPIRNGHARHRNTYRLIKDVGQRDEFCSAEPALASFQLRHGGLVPRQPETTRRWRAASPVDVSEPRVPASHPRRWA
jgi:hypothetical protein